MEELTINDHADFTWDFGCEFFLESVKGNFVWSDPDYGGDNIIRRFNESYAEWSKGQVARSKGVHYVGRYCGDDVKIVN